MAIKVMAKKQNKKLPLPFSYLSPTVPSFSTLCVCSQCPNAGESLIINTVKNVTPTLLYVVQNGSDRLSFLWSQIFNPFFCREKSFWTILLFSLLATLEEKFCKLKIPSFFGGIHSKLLHSICTGALILKEVKNVTFLSEKSHRFLACFYSFNSNILNKR